MERNTAKRLLRKLAGCSLRVAAGLSVCFLFSTTVLQAQQSSSCGTAPSGKNFAGKPLTRQNFSHQDLTGANFEGATLTAVSFLGADLTNASFKNATITNDSTNAILVTDFSMANLTGTCFQGAKFTGTTYFTYSTLTCTDFSETINLSTNAVFGPSPLQFDHSINVCRPAFRSVTMSCEFLNDWQYLDLSKADIRLCFSQITNGNFTNARMAGVDFSNADLDGAQFGHAVLTQAKFIGASLQKADLSYAQLQGATLDRANLTGANLYHAFLSNDTQGKVDSSATAQQAHFKNVNFAFATLSGVDFTYANFYGSTPAGQGVCATEKDNYQGFTKNCATAHGATLSDTTFTNAYLFGVDFTNAAMRGVNLTQAVLVGANLVATIGTNTFSGSSTTLFRSFLQGANLELATLADSVSAANAFVDFRPGGNIVDIYLSGANHNQFACKGSCNPPTGADVCVETYYLQPSTVPSNNQNLTCPDGSAGPCGNADPGGSNAHWKSPLLGGTLPPDVPLFWYGKTPTYPPVGWTRNCNGKKPIFNW